MSDDPWLNEAEQRAWRSYLHMQRMLHVRLASRLQRDFDLSGADYEILVNLSEAAGGRMCPSDLLGATQWEKSRLSHHISRMERRGLVTREPSRTGRYPDIQLTDAGRTAIRRAAPAHAAHVRALVVDVLGPERLARFEEDCRAITDALDAEEEPPGSSS
ncbi:MarR family winged helix-turn-helix transcriptional regulator [Streptomyces clavuligerus]|uniref:Transcriptional regulator, MarR family n=1 Tax=Streptomyces clavuligerus TaxID=1901 RepID=B5H2N2_STRCL|nr:MarR family transcriptional regulator [Streptomyces clavuligerus]EDY52828.1 transcriptional regulator [Streptomyces clavuligerus]EFG04166.1 Transcriptional regulator, MarR family [Streptomyces clavuligerus]MBY6307353.1 MarR family transcriptional regulator [Streptomyces clavuligerus]QCS10083.1 MarR family transcriptional regulator [Streptomyces clavuligerus]QPJ97872.1 MarR family transcriptional regulator [Streptomyces clavuligerus]